MKKLKCYKCGKEFDDVYYDPKLPLAERLYCDNCIDILKNDKQNTKNN